MAKDRIRYIQQSVDDLNAIFDYICLENPDAARKMLNSFRVGIERLSTALYLGAAHRTDEAMLISSGYHYIVALVESSTAAKIGFLFSLASAKTMDEFPALLR